MIVYDDHSEDGKRLFEQIIRRAPSDIWEVVRRIMQNPRNNINWDAVYQDIMYIFPEYNNSKIPLDRVEEVLRQETGYSVFADEVVDAGWGGPDEQYEFDEIADMLFEYVNVYQLNITDDDVERIIRRAFRE